MKFSGDTCQTPISKQFEQFLEGRLGHLEAVLGGREWLAETCSVADILMADVLRLVDQYGRLEKHLPASGMPLEPRLAPLL